ncbi:MAG: polysaccharide biosynthesis tyrosine autokinase [Caldilineaceae bacterium]|nr:polysaccharide biosynthesis tyrosine autokinase [Caldilineaceae bacterium]
MELLQYWKIARKWWWLITLSTVLFGVVGIVYAQRQVPIYSTTTTLIINPAAPSALLPYTADYSVQALASTYTEFMRTRSFAQLVATEMGNTLSVEEITNALSLRYVEGTQIFRITATLTNPELAQSLANTAAAVLINENIARQRSQQEQQRAQLNAAANQEREQLTEVHSVLQQEADYYTERIKNLESEITNQENRPRSDEGDDRLLQLKQELIAARSERIEVLGSLAETQAALAASANTGTINMDTAVVIDAALLPLAPQPGQARQLMILAFLGGLMAGAGLAWLLEYINYTVRTPEELDTYYGIPTQGAIGLIGGRGEKVDRAAGLVTLLEPRSPLSEAFRALRTSIRMANAVKPIHSLLVTSSGPGEGKTFVTSNLAVSLAQEGKRVILVDADLRRPQVHKVFGLPMEPGFTNWAVDPKLKMEQLLKTTPVPNLYVLTCGTIPPNPSELLGSPRAGELFQTLAANADIVLYDTPPAATVTDAVILAAQMDGVLQVVRAGTTRIDLIQRCKVLLERADVHILGPILNGVQVSDLGYYANYYYYGGYYQGNAQKGRRRSWWSRRRRQPKREVQQPQAQAQPQPVVEYAQGQWTLLEDDANGANSSAKSLHFHGVNGNHDG